MKTLAIVHPAALAAAALFQGKDDVRYFLNAIAIQPAKEGAYIIATQGHSMLAIHDPSGICPESVIVKLEPQFLTKCKNRKAERVFIEADGDQVTSRLPDLGLTMTAKRVRAKFPDWQAVIPASVPDKPELLPTFAPLYLELACKAATILHRGAKYPMVRLVSSGKAKPACFAFQEKLVGDMTARCVIMPMKDDQATIWEATK